MSTVSIVLMSILITLEVLSFVKLYFVSKNKRRKLNKNTELLKEIKNEFSDYLGSKESCKLDEIYKSFGKILERLETIEKNQTK